MNSCPELQEAFPQDTVLQLALLALLARDVRVLRAQEMARARAPDEQGRPANLRQGPDIAAACWRPEHLRERERERQRTS